MLMDYVSAIAICNIITINKYLHIFIEKAVFSDFTDLQGEVARLETKPKKKVWL